MAKVIGIISLKGGVGKTSVVANLGTALAQEFQKKVLIVDANFSTPHLGIHVGLINPEYSLHNVLNNEVSPYQAIYQHNLGFHIIPGALSPKSVNPLVLKEKIDVLKDNYDIILIDSSPSLNDEMFATMSSSDEILVVSSPDYPTLTATLQAVMLAKQKNAPIKGIVVNKVRKKRFELTKRDIEKTSDIQVLSVLPDDIKVLEALASMTPVVNYAPKREVSLNYKKLAAVLINEPYKQSFLSKTKARLNILTKKEVK